MNNIQDTLSSSQEREVENSMENAGHYFAIRTQYIKDLSFEAFSPLSQSNQNSSTNQPSLEIVAKVGNSPIDSSHIELMFLLRLQLHLNDPQAVLAVFKVHYTAIVMLPTTVASQQDIDALLNVECPRLMLPYIRQLVLSITSNSLFASMMDFDAISLHYRLANEYIKTSTSEDKSEQLKEENIN